MTFSAREHKISHGDRGIEQTLQRMRRMALGAATNGRVIEWAQSVVRYLPEHKADFEAQAFLTWIRANTRYTADPVGVEVVKTPEAALIELDKYGKMALDCDDQVTLIAAGLNIVGVQTRFAVVAAMPGVDDFSHVYIEYLSEERGWVSMDPIVRGTGIGWSPPKFTRKGHFEERRLSVEGEGRRPDGMLIPLLIALVILWPRRKR